MNYLSIDIGTTACKCQLFSAQGEILKYLLQEYDIRMIDGFPYVDIDTVAGHLRRMIREIADQFAVSSVCISSMGESFVLLGEGDEILFYPMLYTDSRGEEEAEQIKATLGVEKAFLTTGVVPHSMYSLSKLLWIKQHAPEVFARAKHVMLIGDYIGYLLTGERVIDYGLASRTGAFDIEKKVFSEEVLRTFGVDPQLFSRPMCAGSIVGKLLPEWGIDAVLVLGSHDQICTALGAGVLAVGDAVDGMGTVECITTLFREKPRDAQMGLQGYPCVPYPVDGLYCTSMLNYSCGSTVNWLRKRIMHGYAGEEKDFFTYIEKEMGSEPTGILTLPYFGGASTPFQDLSAKGAILNLRTDTRDAELYRSLMEGCAYEMRLNAESVLPYGITVQNAVATGGGANSARWMQIKADIQNIPIKTLRSSEGGLCGCAMLQAVALGGAADLCAAREIFVRYVRKFEPDAARHCAYAPHYQKYQKLYHTLKEFF